jgi:hypothetical protein
MAEFEKFTQEILNLYPKAPSAKKKTYLDSLISSVLSKQKEYDRLPKSLQITAYQLKLLEPLQYKLYKFYNQENEREMSELDDVNGDDETPLTNLSNAFIKTNLIQGGMYSNVNVGNKFFIYLLFVLIFITIVLIIIIITDYNCNCVKNNDG